MGTLGTTLLMAFALALIFEGLLPFWAPSVWRNVFRKLIEMNDGQLRFMGLSSMLVGVAILFLVKP